MFAGFALGAGLGFGLLALAVLFLTYAGIDERAGAGLALLLGQRAQDDAGLRPLRTGLAGGRRGGGRRCG